IIEGRFGDMARLVGEAAPDPIAGVTLDLGVSSMQLDTAERGFSFRFDGPLDMRMSGAGTSAADLVARLSEDELAELIRSLGEERFARRVARAIGTARQRAPIRRTGELAAIIRGAIPTREPGLGPAADGGAHRGARMAGHRRRRPSGMTRLGILFWLLLVLASGFTTFKVKYAVQDIEDELSRVRRQTIAEQQEIRVLTAEWTYL